MNLIKIREPVYDLCHFICMIVGLVVVSSNTKAVVVVVSSAYPLITSVQICCSALC